MTSSGFWFRKEVNVGFRRRKRAASSGTGGERAKAGLNLRMLHREERKLWPIVDRRASIGGWGLGLGTWLRSRSLREFRWRWELNWRGERWREGRERRVWWWWWERWEVVSPLICVTCKWAVCDVYIYREREREREMFNLWRGWVLAGKTIWICWELQSTESSKTWIWKKLVIILLFTFFDCANEFYRYIGCILD